MPSAIIAELPVNAAAVSLLVPMAILAPIEA